MSDSLETTLHSGETSVEQTFQIIPRDKRAFDYGDGKISLVSLIKMNLC